MYVVWVRSLPKDNEERVPAATTKLPDQRASHFWDGDGKLKVAYKRLMKMEELAWDVYYVYGRGVEWKGELPPVPNYYMHQLYSLPPELMLDGDKLAEEINKLLKQSK